MQIERAQRERQAHQQQGKPARSPKKGTQGFLSRVKHDLEDRKHRLEVLPSQSFIYNLSMAFSTLFSLCLVSVQFDLHVLSCCALKIKQ